MDAGQDTGPPDAASEPKGPCGAISAEPTTFSSKKVVLLTADNEKVYWSNGYEVYQTSKKSRAEELLFDEKWIQDLRLQYGTLYLRTSKKLCAADLSVSFNLGCQTIESGGSIADFWPPNLDGGMFWVSGTGTQSNLFFQDRSETTPSDTVFFAPLSQISDRLLVTGLYVYYNQFLPDQSHSLRRIHRETRQEEILSNDLPRLLSTDGLWIYWVNERSEVWRLPRAGGSPEKLVNDLPESTQMLATGGCLYSVGPSGIVRFPREGGPITQLVDFPSSSGIGEYPSIASVDSTHLYWISPGGYQIERLALTE